MQLPAQLANFRPGAAGTPLPEGVRQKMESFFGTSFSDVRVHVGAEASAIGALAFTYGSNLYFAPGQYNPGTPHGQQLLGHELTHVVQQRAGRVRNPFGSGLAVVQDPVLEAEADRMGHRVALQPMSVQPKPAPGAPLATREPARVESTGIGAPPAHPVRFLTSNASAGPGRQIRLATHGREIGSVEVLDTGGDTVRVVNLKVDPQHRQQGAGMQLMRAAASEGLRMGKTRVTLESQDNGSGRLTRWYERMGFAPSGRSELGMVVLEASAISLQARLARTSMEPARSRAPHTVQAKPASPTSLLVQTRRPAIPQGRPPAPHVQATRGVEQAETQAPRQPSVIQPMILNGFKSFRGAGPKSLTRFAPKRRISTFVKSAFLDDQKLEDATRRIAENTGTTFVHPDSLWNWFKTNGHLSNEPVFIVAEQADLNKKVKIRQDGTPVPGIVDVVNKLKKQGLDVSSIPNLTIVSCHSSHAVLDLAKELGINMVTGFDGAVKLDPETGHISIGTVSTSGSFKKKDPEEQIKSIKTVKGGVKVELPPDHSVYKILKE